MFKIGDVVVHPHHGVGLVVKLDDREFERGATSRYYEISMGRESTVWVPVDLPNSTLRPLASKRDLNHCREILKATPRPLTEDGRIRQSDLAVRLRQRTLAVHCEIVRDLSAFVSHKPAYGTISGFLEALLRVLCQEWAMVQEISIVEAAAQINILLDRRAKA